jgi:hypothetical protein
MKRKNLLSLLSILVITFSCSYEPNQSSDTELQLKTEQSMKEANRQVGMPAITNYTEKKLMKMIYELRDQSDYICYAYYLDMNGNKHFLGKCIGYGLPYSTQFSNPEKVVEMDKMLGKNWQGVYPGTIPQPEPNGLFMPEGLAATWLLLINPKTNEPEPIYIEPEIIVSPFPLH